MNDKPDPNTKLGLMQMRMDAKREAQERLAAWLVDFRGRLGKATKRGTASGEASEGQPVQVPGAATDGLQRGTPGSTSQGY